MAEAALLNSSLNLMRRMPPAATEANLTGLINLLPDLTDDLLQRIDQPLKTAVDPSNGRTYVLCDYNRDGDSYRYYCLIRYGLLVDHHGVIDISRKCRMDSLLQINLER